MDLYLKSKTALVTGGAKGIGRAVVESLAAEGCQIVWVDNDENASQRLANSLNVPADRFDYITGDLTENTTCEQAINRVISRYGRLDALINNAGVNDGTGFDCTENALLESLRKNLFHVVAITQLAAPHLKSSKGALLNISSKVATTGQGGTTGYAAAKGAINALTREWAVDFASSGVRVNTVVPAECWTPLYESWINSQPDPEKVKQGIANLVPLENRFTTAREIADMVVFLASPRSAHTTGQIIFVDGGYTHLDRKLSAGTEFHWSDE